MALPGPHVHIEKGKIYGFRYRGFIESFEIVLMMPVFGIIILNTTVGRIGWFHGFLVNFTHVAVLYISSTLVDDYAILHLSLEEKKIIQRVFIMILTFFLMIFIFIISIFLYCWEFAGILASPDLEFANTTLQIIMRICTHVHSIDTRGMP